MDKNEAILRIKSIQSGGADNFSQFPSELKGKLALSIELNDNPELKDLYIPFNYGFEYGEIHGLMKSFEIKIEDLY